MSSWVQLMHEYAESYRATQKLLKHGGRTTPKEYGEHLQKKRKRGKRK